MSRDRYDLLTKRRKKEIKKGVRSRPSMTETRKTKRNVRKALRDGTIAQMGFDFPKAGKFVSDRWTSSGAFKSAYTYARSEIRFYQDSFYADY